MYRCVSVTYKHKTFCKIYTGTPPRTAGSAGVPGVYHKHCSAPEAPRDNPAAGLVRVYSGFRLWRGVLLEMSHPSPWQTLCQTPAPPRAGRRDKSRARQLSLRLHPALLVSFE